MMWLHLILCLSTALSYGTLKHAVIPSISSKANKACDDGMLLDGVIIDIKVIPPMLFVFKKGVSHSSHRPKTNGVPDVVIIIMEQVLIT